MTDWRWDQRKTGLATGSQADHDGLSAAMDGRRCTMHRHRSWQVQVLVLINLAHDPFISIPRILNLGVYDVPHRRARRF